MGGHAYGRAVHQTVGQRHQLRQLRRRTRCDGAAREEAGQLCGACRAAGGVHVHQVQRLHAGGEQGIGDGGTGTSRAKLDHTVQPRAREAGGERGGKAGEVGVVADEPAVLDHHGVDGAEPEGIGGDFIEVRKDQLLARMGDVQAVEAQAAGTPEQIPHGVTGQPELQQVNGAVEVAQALHIAFAFVHGGSEGRHHAVADQSHKVGLSSIAHPGSSFDTAPGGRRRSRRPRRVG